MPRPSKKKNTPPGTTIVVPGGQKGPKLPPSREPGERDPELEGLIAVGKTRYHLDTLASLEAEAASAESLASLIGPEAPLIGAAYAGEAQTRIEQARVREESTDPIDRAIDRHRYGPRRRGMR